jgi:hypothetical protein
VIAEGDRPPHDRRVGPEAPPPESLADDGDPLAAAPVVSRCDRTSEERANAEGSEVFRSDHGAGQLFRRPLAREVEVPRRQIGRDLVEGARRFAQIDRIGH